MKVIILHTGGQRQVQRHYFGRLDALALSLSSEEEAGLGFVIDARN